MSKIQNTSLLVSVKSPNEIEKLKDVVDIIDLKNPLEGALGAWDINEIINEISLKFLFLFLLTKKNKINKIGINIPSPK